MKLPALYELAQQHRELEALADTTDDLPPEVIRDTLEALEGTIQQKAISVAAFVANVEANAEMVEGAAKALAARAARMRRRGDQVRAYLLFNLQATGITKIESPEFTIALRNNPESVRLADGVELPEEFLVQQPAPPPKPDKKALKDALKAGRLIDGAWLESGQRVEIRA